MKIALTGASGRVGAFVGADLVENGHDVVAVDLVAPTDERVEYRPADIGNIDELAEAFGGCDAVIHLAAIPEANIEPFDVTFRINAQGTVNCLEAASRVGAERFVFASSEAVLGFPYREVDFKPDYFPIDEGHRLQPQDSYGVSKVAAEEACRAFTRRGALSTVCVRPCYCWGTSLGEEAIAVAREASAEHGIVAAIMHRPTALRSLDPIRSCGAGDDYALCAPDRLLQARHNRPRT